MSVDSDTATGNLFLHNSACFYHLFRHRAAVCVAKDENVSSGFMCGLQAADGEFRVGLKAVKEVFGIKEQLFHMRTQVAYTVTDQFDISFKGDIKSTGGVEVPCFSEMDIALAPDSIRHSGWDHFRELGGSCE